MGNVLAQMTEEKEGFELAGVIEPLKGQTPDELKEIDVIIDFSNPANLEMLDGYAAVHGHEFLVENEDDIAENITETLSNNYDSKYSFSCEKNRVTAEKKGSDAKLDIEIYTYKKINGELVH